MNYDLLTNILFPIHLTNDNHTNNRQHRHSELYGKGTNEPLPPAEAGTEGAVDTTAQDGAPEGAAS
eukprot:scaffold190_cov171-Amphora_coffeaeformis.AAC.4